MNTTATRAHLSSSLHRSQWAATHATAVNGKGENTTEFVRAEWASRARRIQRAIAYLDSRLQCKHCGNPDHRISHCPVNYPSGDEQAEYIDYLNARAVAAAHVWR